MVYFSFHLAVMLPRSVLNVVLNVILYLASILPFFIWLFEASFFDSVLYVVLYFRLGLIRYVSLYLVLYVSLYLVL